VIEVNQVSKAKKKILFHLPIPIDFGSYNGTQGIIFGVIKYFNDRKDFFEVDAVGGNKFGIIEWGLAQKQEILNFLDNIFVYECERNLVDFLYTRIQSFYYQKMLQQQLPVDSDYFAPPDYVKYVQNLIYQKN
jgi:hypothetical protein